MPSNTEIMKKVCEQMGIPWNECPTQEEISALHINKTLFESAISDEPLLENYLHIAQSLLINGKPFEYFAEMEYKDTYHDHSLTAA